MVSSLIMYAEDGKKFYEAVLKRLNELPGRSINALCNASEIEFSTLWRHKRGSKPDIGTVNKLEKTFKQWERQHRINPARPA